MNKVTMESHNNFVYVYLNGLQKLSILVMTVITTMTVKKYEISLPVPLYGTSAL